MRSTGRAKLLAVIVLTTAFGLMAQSCNSSKRCGCGTDLNSVFKPKKRYRY